MAVATCQEDSARGGELASKRGEGMNIVSSNMKDLSLQQEKSAISNKRAAAQGQSPENGGCPSKLRPASTDDSFGRGPSHHPPRAALCYDAARDQGPGP
jgi:hypothetical protein